MPRAIRPAAVITSLTAPVLSLLPALATANPHNDGTTINWFVGHFPPVHFAPSETTPDTANLQGFGDRNLTYLSDHLTGFNHAFYRGTSYRRSEALIRTSDLACNPTMLKTPEREQYIAFSDPIYVVLPNMLAYRPGDDWKFTPHLTDGKIDMHSLVQDRQRRGSVTLGRSYGKAVDEALQSVGTVPHIAQLRHSQLAINLLDVGRIDYVIAFPSEISHFRSLNKQRPDGIRYFPIKGMNELIKGHVGCTKNPNGLKVIEAVNKIIRDTNPYPLFKSYYLEWLEPEAARHYEALSSQGAALN
ncbi:transporter substrate-binding domain-containing protein [Sneathiella chinensis]|uniref:transporter substrate-binding domain-containing protein n=1 Tax=Sneathiella chinensis TaxID=349750 RepID=UPI00146A6318|nr:transporter substrate-binding domain-containing protein [Sneathiella chinensis]